MVWILKVKGEGMSLLWGEVVGDKSTWIYKLIKWVENGFLTEKFNSTSSFDARYRKNSTDKDSLVVKRFDIFINILDSSIFI